MSRAATGALGVFARHRGAIALAVALLCLTLAAGSGLLALSGHFLTAAALAAGLAGFDFFGPSAGIRALTFARIASRYGEKLFGHDVTLRVARDLRAWFFARALPLAPLGLGRERTGDLLARLVADIEAADGLLVRALGPLLALMLLAAGTLVAIAFVLPAAALCLALAALAIGAGVPLAIGWGARGAERARARARSVFRQGLQEDLDGAADLLALDAVGDRLARLDADSGALAGCESRLQRRLSWAGLVHGLVAAATLPLLLWLLFDAHHAGAIGAPAAAAVLFAGIALLEAAAGAGLAWQSLRSARASLRRLDDIALRAPAAAEPEAPVALPADGTLALSGVRFDWGGAAPRAVLDGIDLALPPGRRIAIAGDSGAGKSSLLALLLRLRDPDGGRIAFGGVDLREAASADWHRRLAWLPQDAPVFAGSVRENLRLGDPAADDARLWAVLEAVRLADTVRALPGGLDGWIGESGASLSGGQARRLALARALLRDAPILLLDEPTEGLDVDTAHALLRDVARLAEGRSLLLISHDALPPGLVHARYRLRDGRLAEE
ncbi:thiol reductant ABC exporter subunit CydC [Luteimonas huabeiensis]|uniref:thiol reductant ABC exporter subunit CydC n=1 Tax=Luteimonas huabeiensis TaxID=1244513 RepID=UPI000465BFE9|nr:thiol reductant ABC exporter subunit CydC [Luteimonas huabeiensis]